MVDYVRFEAARPVVSQPVRPMNEVVKAAQVPAASVGPQTLSLAAALAQKGPPYDADKIAELRAAIASGAYAINLGAVADAMMRFGGGQRV